MGAFIDLSGHRFGRLIVIQRIGTKNGKPLWTCICDCGNESIVTTNDLRSGGTQSCGCIRKEQAAKRSHLAAQSRGKQMMKHGKSDTRLYKIWKSMRFRCNNQNDRYFNDYGGRGIRVCSEWNDYENFYQWAMANGYSPNAPFGSCTIDRINVNGNYEPGNCRWVDMKDQANNRRTRRMANHAVDSRETIKSN